MQLIDEHFRILVDSVQEYAIYLLGPDGTVRSWNAGAKRLKGYEADEIVGTSFQRFFTDGDREAGKPARLLYEARRKGHIEDAGWRVRKDGTQFWANVSVTALHDGSGEHIGFAKVTRDLTDRAFRTFVEATHAIVWTTDANGQPTSDSPSWRAFTGQTEDQWRGKRGWEPVHPDDVDALRVTWPKAKAEGTRFEAEFRLRRHDGAYVWMAARAIPFLDADGGVREWFGVTFDISDRKNAELAAARAIETWKTTLRSIGDAVIATDVHGHVRFMNPVAERLTGWSSDDAAGKPLQAVFPIYNEETGAPVENPVDRVLRTGAVVGLANHTVLRRRDGDQLPIDDSAAPIHDPDGAIQGVVLVFRDVSEEKRELQRRLYLAHATEELNSADDYNDALVRVAQLAVPRLADWASVHITEPGSTQTRQIAVAHVDPTKVELARELGRRYPPDPNAPRGVPNVMRTGRSELYPAIPKEVLEAGAVDDDHLRIIRELDLRSAIVVPLRGKGPVFGAITFVIAGRNAAYTERDLQLAEELAARAALIVERRRLAEEAERANRMKDEFLATMSHELRTPLQAIVGYASMLERGIAREPQKALEAIIRNASAQARLVEDILDVSRITAGKMRLSMTRVEVASTIRAALESIRPSALARQIQLVESVPDDLGYVLGDFDRLQQIVWNLLANAVKFSDPGGTVELRCERTPSVVQIVVRDTGRGIPREHLPVIFDRFRQVDASTTRRHGGLGLGLAIVRHLAEAHGGFVAADSDGPGTGSTFTVTLPADVTPVPEPLRAGERTGPHARPLLGIRVLMVDDNEDARELIAEILRQAGATVGEAGTATRAFDLLQAEPPHVLVSDIGMPGEDGFSLVRRVRALPPEKGGDVPAIALTAYARGEDIRAAHDAGFQLHLVKPVEAGALIDAVSAWAKPRFAG